MASTSSPFVKDIPRRSSRQESLYGIGLARSFSKLTNFRSLESGSERLKGLACTGARWVNAMDQDVNAER